MIGTEEFLRMHERTQAWPTKTLRDEFAMAALAALLGRLQPNAQMGAIAKCAYAAADAMMEARKQ